MWKFLPSVPRDATHTKFVARWWLEKEFQYFIRPRDLNNIMYVDDWKGKHGICVAKKKKNWQIKSQPLPLSPLCVGGLVVFRRPHRTGLLKLEGIARGEGAG